MIFVLLWCGLLWFLLRILDLYFDWWDACYFLDWIFFYLCIGGWILGWCLNLCLPSLTIAYAPTDCLYRLHISFHDPREREDRVKTKIYQLEYSVGLKLGDIDFSWGFSCSGPVCGSVPKLVLEVRIMNISFIILGLCCVFNLSWLAE